MNLIVKNMNLKHRISILAAGLLVMACTNESILDEGMKPGTPDANADPNRQEVMLTLKNNLKLSPQQATRADEPIATEEENYIRSLDVYVFGSPTELGTYTFQELHYYRDDASELKVPGMNTIPFSLLNTAEDKTTKGLLKLNKGLFVKLYCVVNRKKLFMADPDHAGQVIAYDQFKSLVQSAPGQEENVVTPGLPTEADFLKFHTNLINPLATDGNENNVLNVPLPMTGAYTTPIDLTDFSSAARKQISFRLTRMVARFDIVNDAAKSKFTVEQISMGNGRLGASFFPIQPLAVDAPADLITYPVRSIGTETQQAPNEAAGVTNITKGAFYTWPSPKDDEGYLTLKGRYQVNKTESKEVSYQIPFKQSNNGVGTYIEVNHNHRYTIAITTADEYHLDFTLNVEDWNDDEQPDPYEPDNEFDKDRLTVLEASSTEAYVDPMNGQIVLLPQAGSQADFIMGANSALTRELRFKDGSKKWLKDVTVDPLTRAAAPGDGASAETRADASMKQLMSFAVDADQLGDDPSKLLPVTIRLTNKASGENKDITVVPAIGPKLSWTPVDGFVKFNEFTNTVYFYNLDNQSITLTATSEQRTYPDGSTKVGSSVDLSGASYIASDRSEIQEAEGEYVLTMASAQGAIPNPGDKFTVTSIASKAATTVTVVLKDPALTPVQKKDFSFGPKGGKVDLASPDTPAITLAGIKDNYVIFSVESPEGLVVPTNADDYVTGGNGWLKVERLSADRVHGKVKSVYKASIKDATGMGTTPKTDGEITLKNVLDETQTLVLTVATNQPEGPVVTRDELAGDMSTYDPATKTVTMFNGVGQTVTLRTSNPSKVTSSDAFLTLPGSSSFNTSHTITLKEAQNLASVSTAKITLTNEDGGVTEVNFTLADASPSAIVADMFKANAGNVTFEDAATTGGNPKVTFTDPKKTDQFSLTGLVSPRGMRVGTGTNTWLDVRWTTDDNGDVPGTKKSNFIIDINDAAFAKPDFPSASTPDCGTIVLKNVITGGDDLTIDVAVEITPVEPVP